MNSTNMKHILIKQMKKKHFTYIPTNYHIEHFGSEYKISFLFDFLLLIFFQPPTPLHHHASLLKIKQKGDSETFHSLPRRLKQLFFTSNCFIEINLVLFSLNISTTIPRINSQISRSLKTKVESEKICIQLALVSKNYATDDIIICFYLFLLPVFIWLHSAVVDSCFAAKTQTDKRLATTTAAEAPTCMTAKKKHMQFSLSPLRYISLSPSLSNILECGAR